MSEFKASKSRVLDRPSVARRLFFSYVYVIVKNLIGWILILASLPAGALIPGPGGLPMFIIGFAMISFPGKRKGTARVMSGRPILADSKPFMRGVVLLAILLPAGFITYLWNQNLVDVVGTRKRIEFFLAVYILTASLMWYFGMKSRPLINRFLHLIPRARRHIRPWLRRKGIDLLPPRRRRRPLSYGETTRLPDPEILEIHARHYSRMRHFWRFIRPWLKRAMTVALIVVLFVYILRPIARNWSTVRDEIFKIDPLIFAMASVMFAMFLAFRALSWRRILIGFGHRLPYAAAIRIWSMSELARYLPGAIWQVVGRAYLIKPYGVSGAVCGTSQILELAVFLLANIVVAVSCLLYQGAKMSPEARPYLIGAMALVPVLGLLLHPRIFYSIANRVLAWRKRPPIAERLSGFALLRLFFRILLALLWQSVAVYLLVAPTLGLKVDHWWTVAGSYCLAWSAGFVVGAWAPGGLGVREVVFVAAMQVALPHELAQSQALLRFLAVLLRLWTIAGEIIVVTLGYFLDYRGAMGHPDAPGRVKSNRNATGGADAVVS